MRKVISAFALGMVFIAAGLMPVVMAQAPQEVVVVCPEGTTPYPPHVGDNPWRLDGAKWERLIVPNPWLNGRITRRTVDDVHVLIRLTDTLCLPEGVTGADFRAEPAKTATVEPTIKSATIEVAPSDEKKAEATTMLAWFGFFPLAIAIAAIAAYYFLKNLQRRQEREERRRQLAMDPVTSGTPYVPGGIQPNEPDRLETFFERQAIDGYARMNPTVDRATIRVERISPIVRGMLSNEGMVRYHDGQDPRPRRFNPPVPGYQARFRMPDGTEEILQSLQGCMNPVVYGGETLSGFTFTPVAEVVPIPTPAPAPTDMPTGPRAVPAIAARVSAEQVLFTIGGMRMMVPAGSIVRAGEHGEISLTVAGPCDIQVQQRVKKAARPKAVQRTATAE